ncbi:restriction endonuclease [Bradyrhizobium sp. CB82]|uniref:nSTAND3 domain-containing NTPase n=1 Tax=Bradyrhizobium sp. CB82 TaxID=3039159 RepID=UPI0024B1B652|nr:restriction endonuclease [Bradyrhizobium sp. CB82]WFU42722.1 restriction endonuclease [Bradyrhizobium sp. CB82]
MPDYDFHQLSPYDLELLVRDLLQAHWQVTIESFKTGRDGGIDLRYAMGPQKTIVQVKHYLRTGLSGLLRDLENEATKVRRLQPSRYLLVTSLQLTPANKDAVVKTIGADALKTNDVLGAEDLNNLLGQYPAVEGRHYKLWLASRAVLDRVLHNAAMTRSEFKAQQVYEKAKRYVASAAYPQALKMLIDERVVVIAGPPGVGKTTLADLLLYEHLEKGYQAVVIQRDIEEGEQLFQPGLRQIFYFDDFMGATFLGDRAGVHAGSNDRALLNFIAMVRASPTARMVLTTREHVYSQALSRSERLRHSDLGDLRVFLNMPSYDRMQRARILYNHLHFSDLPDAYRDELLRGDFYLKIVKHDKFNPRVIEWLSSYRRLRSIQVEKYRGFVQSLLHDPSEIWRHAYERELTDAGRSLLLALYSLGGKCAGDRLTQSFAALHQLRADRYGFQTRPEDFALAIREVANSFVKPSGPHGFEVIDPSVLDLMNAVVLESPDNAVDLFSGATGFDQVEHLWTFAKADETGAIRATLRRDAARIAQRIGEVAVIDRRIDMGNGSIAFRGPTFEKRLAIIVHMAEQLSSTGIDALVALVFARLLKEWETERPDINDAVELHRALDRTNSLLCQDAISMQAIIEAAILEEASSGCRADELRELISVVDTSDHAHTNVLTARAGFDCYRRDYFRDDLRECRSREQFDGLIEDLELFRDELGVDVSHLIESVEQAKSEYEEHEDAYVDHMQDEWKERYGIERDADRNIAEMFGSLKADRG